MINRVFFISENAFPSGDLPSPEENVYYSFRAIPPLKNSLPAIYSFMDSNAAPLLSVVLEIGERLSGDDLRSITSLVFIPSWLRIEDNPVLILSGDSPDLLEETVSLLSDYLSRQGIRSPIIHILLPEQPVPDPGSGPVPNLGSGVLFRSVETVTTYYKQLLQGDPCHNRNLFFSFSSTEMLRSALAALQGVESDFRQGFPWLYSEIYARARLENELRVVRRKYALTGTELNYQKQYNEVLRSDHHAKEIQDFYTREYEILPLWYKRLGHLLKAFTGKRTFRSLFRDDVKKYKN